MKKRSLLLLLLLALLLSLLTVPAMAVEAEFHYLDSSRDVVIYVSWPTEQPTLTFRAPDGEVYDPLEERSNTVTTIGQTELYYIIYNAPAGQWYVNYNKRGNAYLDIAMFDYQQAPVIEYLDLGQVENNRIPVSFRVTHEKDRSYQYTISAVLEKGGEEKELARGSGTANREISTNVYLNDLASYSAYMLKLYVWYTENETDLFDQVYSQPFAYTNTAVTSAMEDFVCIVEPDTALVYVSWPDIGWNAEQVMVALFEDDGAEPAVYNSYDPDDGGVQLSYDPAAGKLRVEVSVQIDGIYTGLLSKTAEPADCGLTLEDVQATNRLQLQLDYQSLSGETVSVTVNGSTTELVLNGSGDVSVNLTDGWNDVSVQYTDRAGVTWRLLRQVYVDREAPILRLTEAYDGMVTAADSIEILGTILDGDTVTVNGTPAELESDGSFRAVVALKSGENQVVVTAADKLGNESRYTAVITSTTGGYKVSGSGAGPSGGESGGGLSRVFNSSSYLWIIVTGVLCLLVILYALIFWRRRKGGDPR